MTNQLGNIIAEEDHEGAATTPTPAGALPPAGSPPGAQQQTIEIGSPFSVPLDDPTATLHPSPMSNQNLGQVMHLTVSNVTSLTGCAAPPCFSPDEVTMAKLHQAAEGAGAPKYLVDCFMAILAERMSSTSFHPLQPFLPKRKTLLLRVQQAINIPPPQKVEIQLESGHQVSVMRNSFVHLLQEHLVSPVYSDLSNLYLPSSSDLFSLKPFSIPSHTSLIDSRWYSETYKNIRASWTPGDGSFLICSLVLYIDKTGMEQINKSTPVKPLVCTSALLNQEQRQDTNNWIVLGQLPNLNQLLGGTSRGNLPFPARSSKTRDYHRCVAVLLQQVKQLHQLKSPLIVRRRDKVAPMRFLCPIISVIGDNLSQNTLCGRVSHSGHGSVRMSRCCLTNHDEADRIPHHCHRFPTWLEAKLAAASLSAGYCSSQQQQTSSNTLEISNLSLSLSHEYYHLDSLQLTNGKE
jgi:hypothetical protein